MTKLPSLTGEQVIKALSKAGFQVARQRGVTDTSTILPTGLQLYQSTKVKLSVPVF